MTELEQRIETDMVTAMKEKKADELTVLRQLRSSLKNAAIDAGPLDDAAVLKVIAREQKKLNDSLQDFRSAGREDLANKTEQEITIVARYLPQPLSAEELREIVQKVYNDMKTAGTPIQKGAVMGAVIKEVGTRASGSDVLPIVEELMS